MVLQELRDLRFALARILNQEALEVRIKIDPDGTSWLFLGPEIAGSVAAEKNNPFACAQQQPPQWSQQQPQPWLSEGRP